MYRIVAIDGAVVWCLEKKRDRGGGWAFLLLLVIFFPEAFINSIL